MVLHPQARAAVEAWASEPKVYEAGFDVEAARSRARAEAATQSREPVAQVRDLLVPGPGGDVPVRAYRPAGEPQAVVLHLHGGGFVFHDVEVHDASARRLANRTGAWVLSVDYRRPPEHRFPAAPDDVSAVVGWLDPAHAGGGDGLAQLGLGEDAPVAVHGDSAGGNLALVAALRRPGRFAAVALVYPFLDPELRGDSYRTAADGFDAEEAAWYWGQYAATPQDLLDPDLAPLRSARLGTLPPTLVVTCEHDPLRDEGEELVRRLAVEGVAVTGSRLLGQIHGIWRHPDVFDAAEPLMRQVAGFLTQHLTR